MITGCRSFFQSKRGPALLRGEAKSAGSGASFLGQRFGGQDCRADRRRVQAAISPQGLPPKGPMG
eukprot:1271601-Pyramimonas_sp.AAC.1